MNFRANAAQETVRLAPFSGVQFLVYGFNADRVARFTPRAFIEHPQVERTSADGKTPIELRPGWNDLDAEAPPPFTPKGRDRGYDISAQRALEPFLGKWIPAPFLAIEANVDSHGHQLLQQGPTNWARVRVSLAEPGNEEGLTHRVVFAIDTEILERRPNRAYVAPSPQDAQGEQEFCFAYLFRDIAWFLSDMRRGPGGGEEVNRQEWVERWVDELFVESKTAQKGRPPRDDEREGPLEHAARYIAFLQYLYHAMAIPRLRLIDTLSDDPSVRPVDVDLVLDIGASRSCGLLIESFPNQEKIDLGNSFVLQLRDLEEPHRVYDDPFESDVQLATAEFGKEHLSRWSTRTRAFFWPSLVRIGPEAARYRESAEGTEGASGMSSPKRYLCSVEPVNQEWRFQPRDYGARGQPPTIDLAARNYLNFRGDVLRQVAEERRFYERLVWMPDFAELDQPATRLSYSRSSFFTFMVMEILYQAFTLV
ncbi:MAG TPA: virulence factor SrfB, partial [Beijerinckiaceae bacterium]|nr:virulence factor SrfB [Beijerinckiaceae bacterium]